MAQALKTLPPSPPRRQQMRLKDTETPRLKRRLIASLIFWVVLMYFSMGHMLWSWPLPGFMQGNHVAMGIVTDAAHHYHHGHQPKVLYQRL